MRNADSSFSCPSCSGHLKPKVLVCNSCELKVEGDFQLNEFATLNAEDLHFLRTFVRCEGKVREMESALGLSYPTIRTRITDLKNRILATKEDDANEQREQSIQGILVKLETKEISFDDAMKAIRKLKGQKS